jgi:hypothetical protein
MNSVKLLIDVFVSTIGGLLGKATGPVRLLLVLTILAVPGPLLAQFLWKHWRAWRTGYRQRTIDAVSWRPGFRVVSDTRSVSRRRLMQDSFDSSRSREAVYEYSLYTEVLLLTVLAVVFYTAGSRDEQISSLGLYAGAVYFGLLAWAFSRLNALYRRRKQEAIVDIPGVDPDLRGQTKLVKTSRESSLEKPQEIARTYGHSEPQSIMGLSLAQLAIVLLVFVTAILTFGWALKILK